MNGVGGAKAVVDIHHGDPRGAVIQHPQKCRQALEMGTVANGRGHGHQRKAYQAPQNAGEGRFHARDHDEGIVATDFLNGLS